MHAISRADSGTLRTSGTSDGLVSTWACDAVRKQASQRALAQTGADCAGGVVLDTVSVPARVRKLSQLLLCAHSGTDGKQMSVAEARTLRAAVALAFDRLLFWDGKIGAEVTSTRRGDDIRECLNRVSAIVYAMRCDGEERDAARLEELVALFSMPFDPPTIRQLGTVSSVRPRPQMFLPAGVRQRMIQMDQFGAILSVLMLLRHSATAVAQVCEERSPLLSRQNQDNDASVKPLEGNGSGFLLYKHPSFSSIAGQCTPIVANDVSFPCLHRAHCQLFSDKHVGNENRTQGVKWLFGAVSHGLPPPPLREGAGDGGIGTLLTLPLLSGTDADVIDLMSAAVTARFAPPNQQQMVSGGHNRQISQMGVRTFPPRSLSQDYTPHDCHSMTSSCQHLCSDGRAKFWRQLFQSDTDSRTSKCASASAASWQGNNGDKNWWEQCPDRRLRGSTAPNLTSENGVEEELNRFSEWMDAGVLNQYDAEGVVSTEHLVRDVICLLLGLSTLSFELLVTSSGRSAIGAPEAKGVEKEERDAVFRPRANTRLAGDSMSPLRGLLDELCVAGSHVHRLNVFIARNRYSRGKLLRSFCRTLAELLQDYRHQVLSLLPAAQQRDMNEVNALPLLRQAAIWAEDSSVVSNIKEGTRLLPSLPQDRVPSTFRATNFFEKSNQGLHGAANGHKQTFLSVLEVYVHTRKLRQKVRMLAHLCHVCVHINPGRVCQTACPEQGSQKSYSKSVAETSVSVARRNSILVGDLFAQLERADSSSAPLWRKVLRQCLEPYLDAVKRCIFLAEVDDEEGEFMIKYDKDVPEATEEHYLNAFTLRLETECPFSLVSVRTQILRTAQALAVLRACKAEDPLSQIQHAPPLQLRYTVAGVQELRSEHDGFYEHITKATDLANRTHERQVLLTEHKARLAFQQHIQKLMHQYRKIEDREQQALYRLRLAKLQERSGLHTQSEEHVARKRAAAMHEREQDALRVQEQILFGAKSVEELTQLKASAAHDMVRQYKQRLKVLRSEMGHAEWTASRCALQELRTALAVSDLELLRDELLTNESTPVEPLFDPVIEPGGVDADDGEDEQPSCAEEPQLSHKSSTPMSCEPASVLAAERDETEQGPATLGLNAACGLERRATKARDDWTPGQDVAMSQHSSASAELPEQPVSNEHRDTLQRNPSVLQVRELRDLSAPDRMMTVPPVDTAQATDPTGSKQVSASLQLNGCGEEDELPVLPTKDASTPEVKGRGKGGLIVAKPALPLAIAIQECVLLPVLWQYEQVSAQIVSLMLRDLQLERHLCALRRYFFGEDGLWARGLAKRLFLQANNESTPCILADNLSLALQEVLVESGLDKDPFARRLSLRHHLPKARPGTELWDAEDGAASSATGAFSSVQLCYQVEYPLNIIIHPAAHAQYQRVLAFVLDIQRTIDVLQDSWLRLKGFRSGSAARLRHRVDDERFMHLAAFHCLRHEMLHFVSVLHGYLLSQLLHTSWTDFLKDLRGSDELWQSSDEADSSQRDAGKHRARDLHELRTLHDTYLSAVTDRALLSPRTSQVLEIIRQCLRCIQELSQILSYQSATGPTSRSQVDLFTPFLETKARFQHWTAFLHKVISFMLKKGGERQAHLQDLLLRLRPP